MNVAIFIALLAAAFASSVAFRRGRPERWSRRMAQIWYRNPLFSEVARNSVLVMPLTGVLLLPFAIGAWLTFWSPTPPDWPHWARSLSAWGLLSYLSFVVGSSILIAYRRPTRLVPRWLEEDNRRASWISPRPGWSDRFLLVIGIGFLVLGVTFIAAAYGGMTGTRGL
jgi:hypothetical protein